MMAIPPIAAAQAGRASGGGILDSIKAAAPGGAPAAPASGDGSVGLFDGVWKKALVGGLAGGAIGFIPFIPGGPVLGGIVGALGGAAIGVFSNWRTMKAIKAENEATLAALGVQVDDPQVKQILQSGNVSQLIPLMQQGGVGQSPVGQSDVGQASTESRPAEQGPRIRQVTDPATGVTQLINVDEGTVVQEGSPAQTGGITTTALPNAVDPGAAPGQSPRPTQGSISVGSGPAVRPGVVDPGRAPSRAASGGGAAGDAGRPPAPVGVESADAGAIAPIQAGIGLPASGAEPIAPVSGPAPGANATELAALVQRLEQQLEQLKAFLAERDRADQLDRAGAR